MFSGEYLRKYCLARTFNSRVENFMIHLKYRDRLLVGLEYPQEFTVLKTNWFETRIKGNLIFNTNYFSMYLLFYLPILNFLYGSTKTHASMKDIHFIFLFYLHHFWTLKIHCSYSHDIYFCFEKNEHICIHGMSLYIRKYFTNEWSRTSRIFSSLLWGWIRGKRKEVI